MCSTRRASVLWGVNVPVESLRRLRGTSGRDPPRRRVRLLCQPERSRRGQLLGRQGLGLPARLLPRCCPRPRPALAPHVARWVSGGRPGEAEDILSTAPGAARYLADQLAEMRGESNKTISTVRMTMSRSLAFLADPALAASVLPEAGESLDIPSFLRETGTLYLIAELAAKTPRSRRCSPAWPAKSTTPPPCWQPAARRQTRPTPADGPRRSHPDLPRPRPLLARRLRRQRHPDHHRRPRRSPAPRPDGAPNGARIIMDTSGARNLRSPVSPTPTPSTPPPPCAAPRR